MTKKRVICLSSDSWACGLYRINEPFGYLAKQEFDDIEFTVFGDAFPNSNEMTVFQLTMILQQYDAILIQRVASKHILSIMMALKKMGKKVYTEIDDLLMNVSTQSIAHTVWRKGSEALNVFCESLKISDGVLVSTPELEAEYRRFNKNVHTFFNAIDVSDPKFCPANNQRHILPMDKTIVGWAGSSTHVDSLDVIRYAIKPVFDQRKDVVFALCGNKEFMDFFNIPEEQKIYIPHVPIGEFYNIPSMFDIALAPVKENPFNDGKSELKCLESGIWGVPTVCSPVAPYVRFNEVSGGANLIAKKNLGKNWVKQILSLVDNPELRKQKGEQARQTVLREYNLQQKALDRLEFFRKELC
jgi:glycosyltransferase involved in cell wall biosynthesis